MTNIEIPFEKDRKGHYRFFEILPGALSYLALLLPVILSLLNVTLAVFVILLYLLVFFVRSLGYSARAISGYRFMKYCKRLDWLGLLADLDAGEPTSIKIERPSWHLSNLKRLHTRKHTIHPHQLMHAVIIATVNETREVLEPTIKAVLKANYDTRKMIFVIAYEGRAGAEAEKRVKSLVAEYGKHFKHAMAVKHPDGIPGEVIGKGGNITYAGRELLKYVESEDIDPKTVVVTTLDADNRPDPNYFAGVSYMYCTVPNPIHASFQPLAMYTNNIWDVPTLMRIMAVSNNLFYIVGSQRQHAARNFSAHAQSLAGLVETDFWSTRTIVEDGHQFWRSYFAFDGDYQVYPLSIPVYQDAVLADGYFRTLKAQFIQVRRWTYGASDVAYIADNGFFKPNKISKVDITAKFLRTLEGHVTWAVGPLLVYFASRIPPLFHTQNIAANLLPVIVGKVQTVGIIGMLVSVYVCTITLPPRPERYKESHRSVITWILVFLQWVFVPITSVVYGCFAALNSQTRLMFGRYLSKFDITEKAVMTNDGIVSSEADPSLLKTKKA